MARSLYDGIVDYDDDDAATNSTTPNHTTQLAKDVCSFLTWAGSPEHDERKLMGMRAVLLTLSLIGSFWYLKRHVWSYYKTRKYVFVGKPK